MADAQNQFRVVAELTGQRITSVRDLDAAAAHLAIAGLRRRLTESSRTRTGNAWDDRDEDTWIDRL